ncbi:hypothetical protein [Pantoea agglomerans]
MKRFRLTLSPIDTSTTSSIEWPLEPN